MGIVKPHSQAKKKLNKDIDQYLEKLKPRFTKTYTKQGWKGHKEFSYGLISGGSCFLNTIAEHTPSYKKKTEAGETPCKTAKIETLSTYLEIDCDPLQKKYLEYLAHTKLNIREKFHDDKMKFSIQERVKNAKLYLHDGTDIQKPYAKKMENLCRVRDGSVSTKQKTKTGPGFPIEGSVAYHKGHLMPLIMNLYSYENENHKTEKMETFKNQKLLNSCGLQDEGIDVLDRGYDDAKVMDEAINQLHRDFIIRAMGNRNLISEAEFEAQIKACKTQKDRNSIFYNFRYLTEQKIKYAVHDDYSWFKIGWEKVMIRGPNFSKNPNDVLAVTLVSVKITDEKINGIDEDTENGREEREIFLYTTLDVENIEDAIFVFLCYLERWKIEMFFRFLKQIFGLEKVRIQKFFKNKNLAKLLVIAVNYHYERYHKFERIEQKRKSQSLRNILGKNLKKRKDEDILNEALFFLYQSFCGQKNLKHNPDSWTKCIHGILRNRDWLEKATFDYETYDYEVYDTS